jgi:hypothetical protein
MGSVAVGGESLQQAEKIREEAQRFLEQVAFGASDS